MAQISCSHLHLDYLYSREITSPHSNGSIAYTPYPPQPATSSSLSQPPWARGTETKNVAFGFPITGSLGHHVFRGCTVSSQNSGIVFDQCDVIRKISQYLFTLSIFLCWRRQGRRASGGEHLLKGAGEDDMAFWPFGRKRKKKIDSDNLSMSASRSKTTEGGRREQGPEPGDHPSISGRSGRRDNQGRHRSSSRKLSKTPNARMRESEKVEPLPTSPPPTQPTPIRQNQTDEKMEGQSSVMSPRDRSNIPSYYLQNPTSLSSLQPENFNVMPRLPTLRAKRTANDSSLSRRKSSKRRAEDHAREQEIKAMSSPIPIPTRPPLQTGGLPSRGGDQDLPGSSARDVQRPLSDLSLPLPESLTSTVSVASDSCGFRVSAFDALSPRPTIRYFENPRLKDLDSGSLGQARLSTRKDRHPVIPEEALQQPNKRILDLADDLDAGSLRELMERDRRRKERTRISDHEKLRKKLLRREEKQRSGKAANPEYGGGPSKENRDPGGTDQAGVGLGIARATTAPVLDITSFRDGGSIMPESWLRDSSRERLAATHPCNNMGGGTTSLRDAPSPSDEPDDPVLETAKAVRLSQASMSPAPSPMQQRFEISSMLQLSDSASRSTPDITKARDTDARDSDASGRLSNNWTSIFRRSGTRANRSSADRGRTTLSEFSNTSRESFPRQMPPSAFARIPPARSGTPARTQSRFREDLPELPISPPNSRLQSPETSRAPYPPQTHHEGSSALGSPSVVPGSSRPLSDVHPAFREQVAQSRHQSVNSPPSEVPSSAVLSQSLASVDSEGSWLTGKPVKRTSQTPVNPLRGSASSLQQRLRDLGASAEELELAGADLEHTGRLTPESEDYDPHQARRHRYLSSSSGLGGGSEDDESAFQSQPVAMLQEEGKWHGAVGRQPTIVRQGAHVKSREGLLNDFQAAEESTESSPIGESPIGQPLAERRTPPENSLIYRATSVDLGKGHARHMSAGSAKLLNLPPRTSVEIKRFSSASAERSSLHPPSHDEAEENRASDVD